MCFKIILIVAFIFYDPIGLSNVFGKETDPQNSKLFTNPLGMEFVYIPPGTFIMGSPPDEANRGEDEFQKMVTISKGFYIQKTEVTQGQWKEIMGNNPSRFKSNGKDFPIENVSWDEVQKFIGLMRLRQEPQKYRLPTEAEWEYVCRSGLASSNVEKAVTEYDNNPDFDHLGWYSDNSGGKTHAVAQKIPDKQGIYDMRGNVWEWCQDYYSAGGDVKPVIDPTGPSFGRGRVIRGGSWRFGARCMRCANRKWVHQRFKADNLGFRLVREK